MLLHRRCLLSDWRSLEANHGSRCVRLDWTVLGFGTLALVGDLGTVDIALAARVAPHRDRGRVQRARRESRVAPSPCPLGSLYRR
jgi:hypothetical protein